MSDNKHRYGVRDGVVWLHPVKQSYISSKFGYRWHPTDHVYKFHTGIDLPKNTGAEIYSTRAGTVTYVDTYGYESAGKYVIVTHEDGFQSLYMHMSEVIAVEGQTVMIGSVLGKVGSTGKSSGPHLHFGIRVPKSKSHLITGDVMTYDDGRGRIFVNPDSYIMFSGGYSECELESLPDATPDVWINKQLPGDTSWEPFLPEYNPLVGTDCQIGKMLRRRGHLISNSSKILFGSGRVNQNIGLGYNYVGINTCHPTISGNVQSTGSVEAVTREYINNNISKLSSSGAYKKGELSRENQNKVASYILSYLCSYPDEGRRWSPNAVIGMLGNMVGESGLNPARWEGDVNRYLTGERGISRGFGLVQWTPWNKHWDWCENRGYDPYDIDGQLEHIQDEFFGSKGQYFILSNQKYVRGYYNQFSDDPFYTGTTKAYIDRNYHTSNPRLVPIGVEEYPKSNLSAEILTIGFVTNYERPAIKYIHADRRVSNARRFAELFGSNHYETRAVLPKPNLTNVSDYWIPSGVTNNGVMGTNPYLSATSNHISECEGHINNAYVWGRSTEVLMSCKERKDIYNTLCSDRGECWYDYNREHGYYECDKMPRIGSIICWERKSYLSNSPVEKSYLGVVEEVLGSDIIKISRMSTDSKSPDKFEYVTITNENSNWGQSSSNYIFKGFIHILPQTIFYPNVSLHEDGTMHIRCDSTTGESYTSVLFGLKDAKHFNKMKIVYDLKVSPPENGSKKIISEDVFTEDDETSIILDKLDNYCNFYVYMSQQVASCEPGNNFINENWPGTYFPKHIDGSEGTDKDERNMGFPCPDGVVLLCSYSKNDLTKRSKFNLSDGAYVFTDMVKSVQLNRCKYDGIGGVPTFEDDDKVRKFNREMQTYIGVSVTALPAVFDNIRYETSVKLIIKKIILYG